MNKEEKEKQKAEQVQATLALYAAIKEAKQIPCINVPGCRCPECGPKSKDNNVAI